MSCSVRSKHGLRARTRAPGQQSFLMDDGEKSRRHEVTGTWDFKWPLGTEIRVAFQKPPLAMGVTDEEFVRAVMRVVEYAERWPLQNIAFAFMTDPSEFLEPPLGQENSLTDQHRSVFDLATSRGRPYDILVSLQDLPVIRVDPFRALGQEIDNVIFPVSELGSYARRADYGAPTMYIGRFGHALRVGFVDYYEKHSLAQHVTVHEFGHALGIPHMHQHPDLILPLDENNQELPSEKARYSQLDQARASFYRPIPEVQQVIQDALGIEVTPDIVNDHLIEVFRGNKAFSDWVVLDGQRKRAHATAAILDSVMTMPLYQCCAKTGNHADCSRLTNVVTQPRTLDLEMLEVMYVPQPPQSASKYPPAPPPPLSGAETSKVVAGRDPGRS